MKEALKQVKIEFIIEAILLIAIGVVFLGWAPMVIPVMARILAVLLVMIGLLFVIAFVTKKTRMPFDSALFVAGIIIAAVGVWIFLYPGNFSNLIPKIFGVFMVLSGLKNLGQTISLLKYGYKYWWVSLLLAIGTILLGGWLILQSQVANEMLIRIIGASLIYDGISNIWILTRINLFAKAIDQGIRDMFAVDSTAKVSDSDSAEK